MTPQNPARARGRSRRVAVLLVLAGAGLALLASGRTWVTASVDGLPGAGSVLGSGRSVAPAAVAICLVAAAGSVVLGTAGPRLRLVVAALLLFAGIGVAVPAVQALASPGRAVQPALTDATGTTGGTARLQDPRATGWPWLAAGGGLVLAAGGLVGLVRGRRWPGPTQRYDRATDRASDRVAGAAGSPGPAPTAAQARDAALDDWNALSRGDDPTR